MSIEPRKVFLCGSKYQRQLKLVEKSLQIPNKPLSSLYHAFRSKYENTTQYCVVDV